MMYKSSSLTKYKGPDGVLVTRDLEYALLPDGTGYCYWHKIVSMEGDVLRASYQLGSTAYDYQFEGDTREHLACALNDLILSYKTA